MTVEQWPYEPEKRAERLGLPDASEETFQAWCRSRGLPVNPHTEVPQVFLDAFSDEERKEGLG